MKIHLGKQEPATKALDNLWIEDYCSKDVQFSGLKERDLFRRNSSHIERVRKEGKGRIRILIGKILDAKER